MSVVTFFRGLGGYAYGMNVDKQQTNTEYTVVAIVYQGGVQFFKMPGDHWANCTFFKAFIFSEPKNKPPPHSLILAHAGKHKNTRVRAHI